MKPGLTVSPTPADRASISVIIPCFNQARFIGEAIDSVLAQTCPPSEILVVDDGSQDSTAEIVRQYPTVRYIPTPHQGLVAATRNRGVTEASGAYLVFLDGDDRLLPHHLDISLKAFRDRPDAALVCGLFRAFGDEHWMTHHVCDPDDSYGTILRHPSLAMILTAMFRRDILAQAGGFSAVKSLNGCDDPVSAEHRLHSKQSSRNHRRMLMASMTVYRRQRSYVRAHGQYTTDYATSKRVYQRCWGDALIWTSSK
ncbi:MAG TPA: glycosyltransferase family 2 protein [Nitrospiraceae bacterium]|nr:glycosyltransferase family 2 protein [Nitrospiraceae bacterium]